MRKKRDPREAILAATEKLLCKDGHAKTTTRRIAETAKVNQALIHYYFGSVEELFIQVLDRAAKLGRERVEADFSGPDSALDRWERHIQHSTIDRQNPAAIKIWIEVLSLAM